VVAADTFTSPAPDGSKQEANDQAQLYADAQLFCVYCNNEVERRCDRVKNDSWGEDQDSYDRTDVIAANSFCSTDPVVAQLQAQVLADIPTRIKASPDDQCRYGNRRIVARCSTTDTDVYSKIDWETEGGEFLSPASLEQEVVVPENTFFVLEEQGTGGRNAQQEADHLATQVAVASLDCYWENDRVVPGSCDGQGNPVTTVSYGFFAFIINVVLADEEASNPKHVITARIGSSAELTWLPTWISIPADYSVQVSAGDSTTPGQTLAELELLGTGICATISCPTGSTLREAPGLEAGMFTSYISKTDANRRALIIAQALAQCVPLDTFEPSPLDNLPPNSVLVTDGSGNLSSLPIPSEANRFLGSDGSGGVQWVQFGPFECPEPE
jgi:hypothetical protein